MLGRGMLVLKLTSTHLGTQKSHANLNPNICTFNLIRFYLLKKLDWNLKMLYKRKTIRKRIQRNEQLIISNLK